MCKAKFTSVASLEVMNPEMCGCSTRRSEVDLMGWLFRIFGESWKKG